MTDQSKKFPQGYQARRLIQEDIKTQSLRVLLAHLSYYIYLSSTDISGGNKDRKVMIYSGEPSSLLLYWTRKQLWSWVKNTPTLHTYKFIMTLSHKITALKKLKSFITIEISVTMLFSLFWHFLFIYLILVSLETDSWHQALPAEGLLGETLGRHNWKEKGKFRRT
jgi:hypothetical protein